MWKGGENLWEMGIKTQVGMEINLTSPSGSLFEELLFPSQVTHKQDVSKIISFDHFRFNLIVIEHFLLDNITWYTGSIL